jgi:hypothetical protein
MTSEIPDTGKVGFTSIGFMLLGVFDIPENMNTDSLCGYSSAPEAAPEALLPPQADSRQRIIAQQNNTAGIFLKILIVLLLTIFNLQIYF